MVIPLHNTAGEAGPEQYRPHNPGDGPKYLFRKGTTMIVDVHPWSLPTLREVETPLIITESALKEDAILSALQAEEFEAHCVVSIAGVDSWRSRDMPLDDWTDIPLKLQKQGKLKHQRKVIIAHDSGCATNAKEAKARWGLTAYLRRRKADVFWIDVPFAEDGGKQGIDDALAAGHTMAELIASAYRAPDIMPAIVLESTVQDTDATETEKLKAQNTLLQQHVSLLTSLAISPHYTPNEKVTLLRIATCALSDGAHTAVGDGLVELDPGTLSNDFRPTKKDHPEYEEYRRSPMNPKGDYWYLRRSSVSSAAKSLEEKIGPSVGLKATMDYRRAEGDNAPHRETVITLKRPTNMVEFLANVATWQPEAPKVRPYQTQPPCPACGEVHERTVIKQTICGSEDDPGCGAIIGETVVTLPVPPANDPSITDDQRAELDTITRISPVKTINPFTGKDVNSSPSPSPSLGVNSSDFFCLPESMPMVAGGDHEPDEVIDEMPTQRTQAWEPKPNDQTCVDCGTPLPSENRYRCSGCVAEAQRQDSERRTA